MRAAAPQAGRTPPPGAQVWQDVVVVVTGAADGLGREVAHRCLHLGASVVAVDIDAGGLASLAQLGRADGSDLIPVTGDVSLEGTADAVASAVDALGGAVSCAFLNAGIDPLGARSVVETTVELWDRVMAVNLRSAFLLSRVLLPRMVAAGGSLVFTASTAAHRAAAQEAAYTVTKTALLGLARSIGRDFGRFGVRANCLSPGPMEEVMSDRRAELDDGQLAARRAAAEAEIPLGREGRYAEVADAAMFLLGSESSYVSGTSLVVDGGLLG